MLHPDAMLRAIVAGDRSQHDSASYGDEINALGEALGDREHVCQQSIEARQRVSALIGDNAWHRDTRPANGVKLTNRIETLSKIAR